MINIAIIINMIVGIFNICISFSAHMRGDIISVIFNLGLAISSFLIAILLAIVSNNNKGV